jgi:hypothetical protein
MKILFFLLLLFAAETISAQNTISGTVTDEATGKPLARANIFISNTQKGTASAANGEFLLADVPAGNYDLIISMIGYETIVYTYKASQLPLKLNVKMNLKVKQEEVATVRPFEKDGWEKWGLLFTQSFIGTSGNAKQCKIVNKDAIRFRYYKKDQVLEAVADTMLVIENDALGYIVKYQLEGFVYDSKAGSVTYVGYPLFEEMKSRNKHSRNRETAYRGSIMHLMRCLFQNNLAAEGFEMRYLYSTENTEKLRVKAAMKNYYARQLAAGNGTVVISDRDDSLSYYNRIMNQPDFFETVNPFLVAADSVVANSDDDTRYKMLLFSNQLLVFYKNEKPSAQYLREYSDIKPKPYQSTTLFFTGGADRVTFEANGNYYNPLDLFLKGYMGWEKMAELLPLDYEPPK